MSEEISKPTDAWKILRADANNIIKAYQANQVSQLSPVTSVVVSKEALDEFFRAATHYHVFFATMNNKMTLVFVGVDKDGQHIYHQPGDGNEYVLEHVWPCSDNDKCKVGDSALPENLD